MLLQTITIARLFLHHSCWNDQRSANMLRRFRSAARVVLLSFPAALPRAGCWEDLEWTSSPEQAAARA